MRTYYRKYIDIDLVENVKSEEDFKDEVEHNGRTYRKQGVLKTWTNKDEGVRFTATYKKLDR